jgi:hypothetical protein
MSQRSILALAVWLALAAPDIRAEVAGAAPAAVTANKSSDESSAEELPEVLVLGRRENLVGEAISASQGLVGPSELAERPRLRSGDLIEYVPGMVATQHSGSGKANQYFLRGFNLDHGTDFATFVDGMPVNLRTHGHGHGYSDLNFVIPELVGELAYRKGPYHADVGDFGSAGSAAFRLAERLPSRTLEGAVGEYGYTRALGIGTLEASETALTYGIEAQRYDGPWSDIDEDVRKFNLALKASFPLATGSASLTALAYDNDWNSPDQVPERAIGAGLIDAFGSLDTDLGGESERRSLSGAWRGPLADGEFSASAYAIDYELSLFSNFTYFLDDPLNGDEFRQRDERQVYGFDLGETWSNDRWQLRLGLQGRRDDIDEVGLCRTTARVCRDPVRDDAVIEDSIALWLDGEYRFDERLRVYAGLRHDRYQFEVDAIEPENSGRSEDSKSSAKASLIYTVSNPLELYLSWGEGFHSNDARGTVISIDPLSGEAVEPVTPLVASLGSELGVRLYLSDTVHATAALWQLDLDSELLFVGDAGTTEPTRASERRGAEVGLYWFGGEGWNAELEIEYTDAEFSDDDPAGREIPGAIPVVVSGGINWRFADDWFATARVRHFSSYPLIEDDSVESDGSTMLNLRLGRRIGAFTAALELLNALDSDDHDIDYFYASRLPGEAAGGVEDVHFHVFEPRALRLALRYDL